jgi:hypothetical protein
MKPKTTSEYPSNISFIYRSTSRQRTPVESRLSSFHQVRLLLLVPGGALALLTFCSNKVAWGRGEEAILGGVHAL